MTPPGNATRPTADRVRQALFDRLLHAAWAGRAAVEGVAVLDAFAGTGALGLEALSRGAATAAFIERDRAALAALRANIATCGAAERCTVIAGDATRPPSGRPCGLVLLDPPYDHGLLAASVPALTRAGWLAPGALLVAELGRDERRPDLPVLAEWAHGAARMLAWRV